MASPVEIIDISSDEEDDGEDEVNEWLKAMLDDDDDVVVDELLSAAGAGKGDSDDDCVVLDGDPDKPVEIADGGGGGGEDDLLIVGEKGQVACRDYPHPRHLCATFPFSSTLHVKHCNLCHCYVCDTRAPCIYWFTGVPNNDHCHSTDKDSKWKYLRKVFKQRDTFSLPPQKLPQQPPIPTQPSTLPSRSNTFSLPPQKLPQQPPIPTQPPTLSSRSNVLRPCPATATITRPQPLVPAAHISSTRIGGPYYPRVMKHIARPQQLAPAAHNSSTRTGSPRDPRLSQFTARSHSLTPAAHNVLPQKRSSDPIPALVIQQQSKTRKNVTWHADARLRAAPQRYGGPPAELVEENIKTWQNVLDGVAVDLGVGVDRSNIEVQDTSSSVFVPLAPPSAPFRYDWLMNNAANQEAVAGEPSVPPVPEDGGLDPPPFDFNDPWASIPGI